MVPTPFRRVRGLVGEGEEGLEAVGHLLCLGVARLWPESGQPL